MRAALALVATLLLAACQTIPAGRDIDVIYVPTPYEAVDAMLALGEVKAGDVLYDLGSGDGRIPIEAARRFGARGVGIELSEARVAEARANSRAAGVDHLVRFRRQDLFAADIGEATVVMLYLLPELNQRLKPKLRALPPGTRIVSYTWDMGAWVPEKIVTVAPGVQIYLWRVPEKGVAIP
ncbi:SAM-dependent methyltransferase [Phenylobacterium sp.]|uniref:SAM-dependent methyltransferase n=1 Tax=Phenylobacterium sp. TaxID=1871053 RepID=UPI003D29CBF5